MHMPHESILTGNDFMLHKRAFFSGWYLAKPWLAYRKRIRFTMWLCNNAVQSSNSVKNTYPKSWWVGISWYWYNDIHIVSCGPSLELTLCLQHVFTHCTAGVYSNASHVPWWGTQLCCGSVAQSETQSRWEVWPGYWAGKTWARTLRLAGQMRWSGHSQTERDEHTGGT